MKVTPPVSAPNDIADFIALRRRLHAAPELSREEFATSALVAELLTGWGYEVATGIGGAGVVAYGRPVASLIGSASISARSPIVRSPAPAVSVATTPAPPMPVATS